MRPAHRLRPITHSALPGILLAVMLPRVAVAQPAPYRVSQLAPDVHLVTRDIASGRASDSNVLIIINDVDVVVVDSDIFPESARQVIAEIRKRTTKPVRYVINTHWHSDHHYGNAVYRAAYPGVEFIGHPYTRAMIEERDAPDLAKNLATEYPGEMARLRKALETGKRSNGEPVTPALRPIFEQQLADYEFFVREMKNTPVVPPTLTVADSLTLHRGERTIAVKFLGLGNTAGDLIVYLPKERIVATGDLVVTPVPFAFESYLREWPGTLRALMRLDAGTIVPGHGEVMHDWGYVTQLASLIETTWNQVSAAVASGKDLEGTRTAVNVDSFRSTFGGTSAQGRRAFDALFLSPGVEAAYRTLRPDGK